MAAGSMQTAASTKIPAQHHHRIWSSWSLRSVYDGDVSRLLDEIYNNGDYSFPTNLKATGDSIVSPHKKGDWLVSMRKYNGQPGANHHVNGGTSHLLRSLLEATPMGDYMTKLSDNNAASPLVLVGAPAKRNELIPLIDAQRRSENADVLREYYAQTGKHGKGDINNRWG